MKLERTLIELETLTDYGTRYLLDVNSAYDDGVDIGRDMVADLSIREFMDLNGMGLDDVLDGLDSYDICKAIHDKYSVGDVFYDDDIIDYCNDNISADDVYDARQMLDTISTDDIKGYFEDNGEDIKFSLDDFDEDEIKEWVVDNLDVAEMVEWQ